MDDGDFIVARTARLERQEGILDDPVLLDWLLDQHGLVMLLLIDHSLRLLQRCLISLVIFPG